MESFGESGAYLWGAAAAPRRGGTLPGDEPEGYRAFATWEPVPTRTRPARSPRSGPGSPGSGRRPPRRAHASPRTATTSRRRTAGCWPRPGGSPAGPGSPRWPRSSEFIADTAGSTCSPWSASGSCAPTARASSAIAPVAGFTWRDPEASGENSMRWYRDAVGMDGAAPDAGPAAAAAGVQRRRRRGHRGAAGVDDVPGRRGGAAGRRSVTPQVARRITSPLWTVPPYSGGRPPSDAAAPFEVMTPSFSQVPAAIRPGRREGWGMSELASESMSQRPREASTERSEGVRMSELASESMSQRPREASTERSEGVR